MYNHTCKVHLPHMWTLFFVIEQYSIAVIELITFVARFHSSFVFIFTTALSIYAFVVSHRFIRTFCSYKLCCTQHVLMCHTHSYLTQYIIIRIIFGKRQVCVHTLSELVSRTDIIRSLWQINFGCENMHFVWHMHARTHIRTHKHTAYHTQFSCNKVLFMVYWHTTLGCFCSRWLCYFMPFYCRCCFWIRISQCKRHV